MSNATMPARYKFRVFASRKKYGFRIRYFPTSEGVWSPEYTVGSDKWKALPDTIQIQGVGAIGTYIDRLSETLNNIYAWYYNGFQEPNPQPLQGDNCHGT